MKFLISIWILLYVANVYAQPKTGSWGDQGDGTYINPILNADYSDPDVVRAGDKYYMVCSEFQYMGMPVLESDDMVNWKIITQIYSRLDFPDYDNMNSYSNGSWAPSIRYHAGKFRVYFCTIPEGLFMYSAEKPEGPWSMTLVKNVEKWEDPCPFWDDDGKAYLVHSVKGAGPIIIHRMSEDGTQLLDDGVTVYTGPVAEGPKMFKRGEYYYISIPEGGVATGWQTILRSKNIYGPYEKKVVLEQGSTSVNGPHQGALVDTPAGEWWFYHFQQVGALGRVVHLQPVRWIDDWPQIGVDIDHNGIGEPVRAWKKPDTGKTSPIHAPQADDDFNAPSLGLQWQFNHNPDNKAWSLTENPGYLSLKALKSESFLRAKNTLTQKVMGMSGEAVVALDVSQIAEGQKAGLCSFSSLYNLFGVYRTGGKNYLFFENNESLFDKPQVVDGVKVKIDYFDTSKNYIEKQPIAANVVYLKVKFDFQNNVNHFYYSTDNIKFIPFGKDFQVMFGFWKGTRIGLFSYNEQKEGGTALFDWFKYNYDGPGFIDREALITRNNPHVTEFDSLSSLSVGNGEFAMTVDVTGLQTFPEAYKNGVPLGTQSQWGWHSFSNPQKFKPEETLKSYNFGRGRTELYSVQDAEGSQRRKDAVEWFRVNPHRLHLGIIGLELDENTRPEDIKNIDQQLDMWNGVIHSRLSIKNQLYEVNTVCDPDKDRISAKIVSTTKPAVKFHFAYPTGAFADDGCDWTKDNLHTTTVVNQTAQSAVLKRIIDKTVYYVTIGWEGNATLTEKKKNYFVLSSSANHLSFSCSFTEQQPLKKLQPTFAETMEAASSHWTNYWKTGAVVDFSNCKDPRARELERRVVLSQYLLAIQCAGSTPPQETGLTYNSWYGKFHLEMIWWHQAQFALWGHPELLDHTLSWYQKVYPVAKKIAERQGFDGVRWMKMTDPSGSESPSSVGSFLIWQQPHIIYLAELIYRANPSKETLEKYGRLIQATADFMYSFATFDKSKNRYILKGLIPAQETLKPETTVNPPFELSYWRWAIQTAQEWRERAGYARKPEWDALIDKLAPLAQKDSLYLAAESAPNTYHNIQFYSDHPAVLGAFGVLPDSKLFQKDIMENTLHWVLDNWNWDQTWGWDYPMTAMNAARLGEPEKAVDALLMDKKTNTYLLNGHNYQDDRLRIYLPGNGALLTAVAMMCAGWDGCETPNPGFPKDGNWDVRWEGLKLMP